MSEWVEHALGELRRAGYRRGGARTAVVEVLARHSCARTALEIDDELRAENRRVGRASVYRALEQLDGLGLVSKVEVGHGTARYEPVRPGGHHHHHLVCDDCGNVLPFEDPELERSIDRLSRRLDFRVAEHDVVLHGSCGCAAAAPRERGR
jgi:Fur family ferric uptake transcriptional regulator